MQYIIGTPRCENTRDVQRGALGRQGKSKSFNEDSTRRQSCFPLGPELMKGCKVDSNRHVPFWKRKTNFSASLKPGAHFIFQQDFFFLSSSLILPFIRVQAHTSDMKQTFVHLIRS